jgi:hypothetical protein
VPFGGANVDRAHGRRWAVGPRPSGAVFVTDANPLGGSRSRRVLIVALTLLTQPRSPPAAQVLLRWSKKKEWPREPVPGLGPSDLGTDVLAHRPRFPGLISGAGGPARSGCTPAGGYRPALTPGEEFAVCVTVTVRIPLLPKFTDANTAIGQFLVERDRYVDPWLIHRSGPVQRLEGMTDRWGHCEMARQLLDPEPSTYPELHGSSAGASTARDPGLATRFVR